MSLAYHSNPLKSKYGFQVYFSSKKPELIRPDKVIAIKRESPKIQEEPIQLEEPLVEPIITQSYSSSILDEVLDNLNFSTPETITTVPCISDLEKRQCSQAVQELKRKNEEIRSLLVKINSKEGL